MEVTVLEEGFGSAAAATVNVVSDQIRETKKCNVCGVAVEKGKMAEHRVNDCKKTTTEIGGLADFLKTRPQSLAEDVAGLFVVAHFTNMLPDSVWRSLRQAIENDGKEYFENLGKQFTRVHALQLMKEMNYVWLHIKDALPYSAETTNGTMKRRSMPTFNAQVAVSSKAILAIYLENTKYDLEKDFAAQLGQRGPAEEARAVRFGAAFRYASKKIGSLEVGKYMNDFPSPQQSFSNDISSAAVETTVGMMFPWQEKKTAMQKCVQLFAGAAKATMEKQLHPAISHMLESAKEQAIYEEAKVALAVLYQQYHELEMQQRYDPKKTYQLWLESVTRNPPPHTSSTYNPADIKCLVELYHVPIGNDESAKQRLRELIFGECILEATKLAGSLAMEQLFSKFNPAKFSSNIEKQKEMPTEWMYFNKPQTDLGQAIMKVGALLGYGAKHYPAVRPRQYLNKFWKRVRDNSCLDNDDARRVGQALVFALRVIGGDWPKDQPDVLEASVKFFLLNIGQPGYPGPDYRDWAKGFNTIKESAKSENILIRAMADVIGVANELALPVQIKTVVENDSFYREFNVLPRIAQAHVMGQYTFKPACDLWPEVKKLGMLLGWAASMKTPRKYIGQQWPVQLNVPVFWSDVAKYSDLPQQIKPLIPQLLMDALYDAYKKHHEDPHHLDRALQLGDVSELTDTKQFQNRAAAFGKISSVLNGNAEQMKVAFSDALMVAMEVTSYNSLMHLIYDAGMRAAFGDPSRVRPPAAPSSNFQDLFYSYKQQSVEEVPAFGWMLKYDMKKEFSEYIVRLGILFGRAASSMYPLVGIPDEDQMVAFWMELRRTNPFDDDVAQLVGKALLEALEQVQQHEPGVLESLPKETSGDPKEEISIVDDGKSLNGLWQQFDGDTLQYTRFRDAMVDVIGIANEFAILPLVIRLIDNNQMRSVFKLPPMQSEKPEWVCPAVEDGVGEASFEGGVRDLMKKFRAPVEPPQKQLVNALLRIHVMASGQATRESRLQVIRDGWENIVKDSENESNFRKVPPHLDENTAYVLLDELMKVWDDGRFRTINYEGEQIPDRILAIQNNAALWNIFHEQRDVVQLVPEQDVTAKWQLPRSYLKQLQKDEKNLQSVLAKWEDDMPQAYRTTFIMRGEQKEVRATRFFAALEEALSFIGTGPLVEIVGVLKVMLGQRNRESGNISTFYRRTKKASELKRSFVTLYEIGGTILGQAALTGKTKEIWEQAETQYAGRLLELRSRDFKQYFTAKWESGALYVKDGDIPEGVHRNTSKYLEPEMKRKFQREKSYDKKVFVETLPRLAENFEQEWLQRRIQLLLGATLLRAYAIAGIENVNTLLDAVPDKLIRSEANHRSFEDNVDDGCQHVCHCPCHTTPGIMHMNPCCYRCKVEGCGRMIRAGANALHRMNCHVK